MMSRFGVYYVVLRLSGHLGSLSKNRRLSLSEELHRTTRFLSTPHFEAILSNKRFSFRAADHP